MGRVRISRFLAVTTPAVLACGGLVLAIMLGYVSVAFASTYPLDLTSSHGTADRLAIALGSDAEVSGIEHAAKGRRIAVINVSDAELADLCLVPRLKLPVVGRLFSLRISSGRTVKMASASLATAEATVARLDVPEAHVGASPEDSPARPGGFAMSADGGVELDGLDAQVYGLRLDDGMSMRSLMVRPRLGDQHC